MKPRFQDFLFCGRFYEANGCGAPFVTLFILSCTDGAMCRLPGGTTFRRAGCLPRTFLRGSFPRSGAGHFSHERKVTKSSPKPTVLESLFAEDFMKRIAAVRRSVRCLSLGALTFLVCPHPAGPAAHKEGLCSLVRWNNVRSRHYNMRKCRAGGAGTLHRQYS